MKTFMSTLTLLFFMVGAVSVSASTKLETYSATISRDGKIVAQKPNWIKAVDYDNHKNYAASYKMTLMPGAFQLEPKYCHVSTFDNSSYEHTLYGVAKLSNKPSRAEVNVIALMLGNDKPAEDSSMSFYLVCGK